MKTFLNRLLKMLTFLTSTTLLFNACLKDATENDDYINIRFIATSQCLTTKTIISSSDVLPDAQNTVNILWTNSDKVSVFDGEHNNCEFICSPDSNDKSPSCTILGEITATAMDYFAIYPYNPSAIFDGKLINGINFPAKQEAIPGSYDPNAAIMVARTIDGEKELAFKNLVGYLKITTTIPCKKIEIQAADRHVPLSGDGIINIIDGNPTFNIVTEGSCSSIVLEGLIDPEENYYIAFPEITLDAGWVINFTTIDGNIISREIPEGITFKKNVVIDFNTFFLENTAIPYITFSSPSEQSFSMDFKPVSNGDAFILGEDEYFEYSVGNDEIWNKFTNTVIDIPFGGTKGDFRLRGISSKGTANVSPLSINFANISFSNSDVPVNCSGDIRTLINYKDYDIVNTIDARFCYLFIFNSNLISAPELPLTVLADHCFYGMFQHCTSLIEAPKNLPATVLANSCYADMFFNCSSLVTSPTLPATVLAYSCYNSMFYGCTSLINAPELPATTMADSCYRQMFFKCSSLTYAPNLPATTLARYCYQSMFYDCDSLTYAPSLPATTLADYCYSHMFDGCAALVYAPQKLPAMILADNCYEFMFFECSSLRYAPALPATTLADSCYQFMFTNCISMVSAPTLPATTLFISCYESMFYNCVLIKSAPALPATDLAIACYANMFYGCSSLEYVPELPATTLANSCYSGMFSCCSSLSTTPTLPATDLADYCYSEMFYSCSKLEKGPELNAKTLVKGCYNRMFQNCSSLNYVWMCGVLDEEDDSSIYFHDWLKGVASNGELYLNKEMAERINIPYGWIVSYI